MGIVLFNYPKIQVQITYCELSNYYALVTEMHGKINDLIKTNRKK